MNAPAPTINRAHAEELDRTDPLGAFRDRHLPTTDEVVAYPDGNSLGRPLVSIGESWQRFTHEQWAGRLIRGWSEGWMDLPEKVDDELAAAALGAAPGTTIIADSTTVTFYKAMRAALNLRPDRRKVVLDRDNFPTDRFVVESLANDLKLELVWLEPPADGGVTAEDVAAVVDEQTAVVTLSHVAHQAAYLADVPAITEIAHQAGALVVWELCHSVSSTEIELDAWDVDFAVGCTYKFVGAGPGAPALVYANARHHGELNQPIWGWLGRRDSFEMEQGYLPAPGIRSMLSGTPPVFGLLAVREGAAIIAEAGIGAIRAKAVALMEMAAAIAEETLVPQGFAIMSPGDPARRGGHVSIARPDARDLSQRLTAAGVLIDFRAPEAIRIGLSPLPTSFTEVWDALDVIRTMSA